MNITHLSAESYVVSRWSGGSTTQLAIAPKGAAYADRDFLWRVSSATVELDSSDFTPLPDYDRLISVLEGEMRLRHNGGAELTLAPYQVHRFDGGADTHSQGRCTDFNLMTRKGRCQGSLEALMLRDERQELRGQPGETLLLYCGQGSGSAAVEETQLTLSAGESVLLEGEGSAVLWGQGAFFLARMSEGAR